MNRNETGKNYDGSLSCKQIAALTRQYIKKFSGYKFSVRSDLRSVKVYLQEIPRGSRLLNPDWCYCMMERSLKHVPHFALPEEARNRFLPQIQRLIDEIQDYLNSYNYDNSDTMTDYFDVFFYGFVEVDYDLTAQHEKLEGVRY